MITMEASIATRRLEEAVLHLILAREYAREEDPFTDASVEHSTEGVMLAARDLTRAVEAMGERDRPVGWDQQDAAVAQ